MSSDISYFGETTFRRRFTRFGIKQADRLMHTYILGKTGVGKSTLLGTLAAGDIEVGRGFALIDPHGDLVERLYASMGPETQARTTYLNATDATCPFGYNPLRRVREDRIPLAVSGILESLEKLWPNAWGVRMEHVLRSSLYALIEREGSVLPDVLRLYSNKEFRKDVVRKIRNPVVKAYWTDEFANYPPRYLAEAVAPIQNKLGAVLSDPRLFRILAAPAIDIHFRRLMDEGGILLVNLSKGQIGEDAAHLLGGLIVSTLGLAALSRGEITQEERRPFIVYVDEFQTFTTLALVSMWSELRKFGAGIVATNQYLSQLNSGVRHAVLGNAGTIISFRVGAEDAGAMAREFQPTVGTEDLLSLPNRHLYLKLMIDAAPSKVFSARTL